MRFLVPGRGSDGWMRRGVRRAYLGLLGKLQPGHYVRFVVFVLGWIEERCVLCWIVMLLLLVGYVGDGTVTQLLMPSHLRSSSFT